MSGVDMAADPYRHFKSIKHGACADAIHDFKGKKINADRQVDPKNPGLPEIVMALPTTGIPLVDAIPKSRGRGEVEGLRHESTMLQEIFKDIGLPGLVIEPPPKDQGTIMEFITDALSRKPDTKDFFRHDFNIETIDGQKSYSVKLLSKPTADGRRPERNIKKIKHLLTTDDYSAFFGTNNLHVIIDFQTIGWNDVLKTCQNGDTMLEVTSLINREVANDPAKKTCSLKEIRKDRDFTDVNNKLRLNLKFETSKANIIYAHTESNDLRPTALQRDKLFSIMDFCLSPMQMKGNSIPDITLDIINPTTGNVYPIDNPSQLNSITECWSAIVNIFKKKATKQVDSGVLFQCKRSGDWLQALSCLDLERPYINRESGKLESIPSIKLITHDMIMLWYALFLGIDVLFTYRIGAGKTVESDTTDDDDDPMSEKILLHFTNTTKSETPEIRAARSLIRADEFITSGSIEIYKAYTAQYDLWITEIRNERAASIRDIFNRWLNDSMNQKLIQDLLRAYWQFTSINYRNIGEYYTIIQKAKDEFTRSRSSKDANEFISGCINFESLMRSIPDIDSIRTSSNAYKKDPKYSNMVNLMTIERSGRSKESEVFAVCEFLISRLERNSSLDDMKEKFTIISNKLKQEQPTLKYLLHKFVSKLNEQTDADEGELSVHFIQDNAAALRNTVDVVGPIEEEEEDEALEEEPLVEDPRNKRKSVTILGSAGKSIKQFASRIFNKRREPRPQYGGFYGYTDSYILCQCYLFQLMNSLNGFDSYEDQDYVYYDALTRLVVSCFITGHYTHDSLQAIFYDVLPSGQWNTGFLGPNFTKNVSSAAYNVAHHSIDMLDGDIPSLGNMGTISPLTISNFQDMTAHIKDMNFHDRQIFLFKQIVRCIELPFTVEKKVTQTKPKVPIKSAVVKEAAASMRAKSEKQQDRMRKMLRNERQSAMQENYMVAGGKRTRRYKYKRRNGSPRRSTRRTTRRHRI